ncbi:hypothetical protein [Pseudomonas monteilii]|uniref:hypothetical protein n=1 Tax=Pseudomonas monteilii TaxID=76759 RepID=UPI00048DB58E|nr:hypothetical protein [Pseudomonas monteilii]
MPSMIKVQTCDLAGKALLWAIEMIEGPIPAADRQVRPPGPPPGAPRPPPLPLSGHAIDDAAGEYLIQKHGIWIDRGYSWPWLACVSGNPLDRQPGDTRAEAAARAVVHHARGETINVPKEMLL